MLRSTVVDEPRDQRALRASDADREQIADVLRQAAADGRLSLSELDERIDALYAAKTYGELEPVVHDLPADVALPPVAAPIVPRPAAAIDRTDRVGGTPGTAVSKAVFGGIVRRGEWVVPSHYRLKAVFGGAELDLRDAQLETHEVTIEIKAVFGGVNIVVPPDVRVVVDGDGIFGGFNDDTHTQPPTGSPVVRVGGKAVFGGVNVTRKPVNRS